MDYFIVPDQLTFRAKNCWSKIRESYSMPPEEMNSLPPEKRESYRKHFQRFDKDGNGQIDPKELLVLMQAVGQNPSKAEVEDMIHEVDTDGTGTIGFEEFLFLMEKYGKEVKIEEQLRKAFKVFDKNGDGLISAKELKEVMMNLGEKMSEDEVIDMIAEADLDGDGVIDYEEFIVMMTQDSKFQVI